MLFAIVSTRNPSYRLEDFVSPCNISGKIVESSSMASSIALASPTYDCEPASGKDAVSTGAFDIRKSKSMVCVPFSGSW